MKILVAGPDTEEIGPALKNAGASVTPLNGEVTARALREAGIDEAAVFVLTDPSEATAIPIAREAHDEVRVVVYANDSLPEFASPMADLIIDPAAIDQSVVVEELLGTRKKE